MGSFLWLLSQVATDWVTDNSHSVVSRSSGSRTSAVKVSAGPRALGGSFLPLPLPAASPSPVSLQYQHPFAPGVLPLSVRVSSPGDTGRWI